MRMQDHHCEFLGFTIEVPPSGFDRDRLLKQGKDGFDTAEQDIFRVTYGSREYPNEEHSHITVIFRKTKVVLRLSYHASSGDITEDGTPPHLEDCAEWLGSFLNVDGYKAKLEASFAFNENYAPVFYLPFPFLAASKELVGTMVTGVKLKLSKGKIKTVVIQKTGARNIVNLDSMVTMDLKSFGLRYQLEDLSGFAKKFVKLTGESDE